MIIKHKELVNNGRKILEEKGFKEKEIIEEYPIKLKKGSTKILDIAGVKGDYIVGIECGGLTKEIDEIKEVLSEFIYLPYVTKKGNHLHCSNCDYSWFARVEKPKQCPKCKRYFQIK